MLHNKAKWNYLKQLLFAQKWQPSVFLALVIKTGALNTWNYFLSLNPFYDHSDHIPLIKTTLNYNFHKSKINLLIKIFFGNTNLETFMLFVFKNLIGVKDNLDLFLFLFCQQKGMIKPWRWHQFKRDKWMVHSQYYFALLHTQSL